MHGLTIALALFVVVTTAAAQDSAIARPVQDSAAVRPDSGPTPAQKRYIDGLRTAGRGVAQLKDGVERVLRTRASADTARQRQAGLRLGGLCGTAHGFVTRGRAQMSASAYEDSVAVIARQLGSQLDSMARYLPTCQKEAGKSGEVVANHLVGRLKSYEAALQRYREAVGIAPAPAPPGPAAQSPKS